MWTFKLPTEIRFGNGAAGQLSELSSAFGCRKMVVTDRILAGLPQIQALIAGLGDVCVFTDVNPNPTVDNVDALGKLLIETGTEVIVAIGGGSAIDCAKAAACLVKSGIASIRPFHSEGKKFETGNGAIPLIAVPTTAGTGSEVTPFAVLDDTEKNFKGPIACEMFYPKIAVIDPELTLSVPVKITATTALDALSHAIEGYWSKNHQPICDLLALEAAKNIFANLENVLNNSGDKCGREALAYAALLAGMAFQLPKNAIMHACSFPLSNRFHLPHGAACAFTMEAAIRLNTPFMGGRMEKFAEYCGFDSIAKMIKQITRFKTLGGLPRTLADAGIGKGDIELLVQESFHPLMNNNPKPVTAKDLKNLYLGLENGNE